MIRKLFFFFIAFCLLPITVSADAGFKHFVRAEGDKLMDGDKEYRFISFNIPNLHMIEDQMPFDEIQAWRLPDTYELNDALESVAQMGGQVVRIYTITVKRPDDLPGTPKHVLGPGQFNEEAFQALDNMMALAAEHGIRVIIPLMDNWPWMGGRAEYAGFRGKEKDKFWTDPQLRDDFKQTINFLINRTNSVTGIRYRDDKTLLAWETGNELQDTPEWATDIAAYIRDLDPNHLIIDGNSFRLRESSLNDPNISLVTTHHYEPDPGMMARNIRANMAMARGRKPYFVGEFGFISTAGLDVVVDAIIDSGSSGGLSWSLRFHSRDGGFYWHSEMLGLGLYKAFHWPGFASGEDYDEINVMKLMREKAFEIRSEKIPKTKPPKAPLLLPIESPAAINWQGSVGASGYDIQRRELSGVGGWETLVKNISDAREAYRPLYIDKETVPGETYKYRVRALNSTGVSKWSNVHGPVKGIGPVLVDPMMRTAQIFTSGGELEFTKKDSRQAKEDIYRLKGQKGAFIVYYLKDPFDQFQIDAFFQNTVEAPVIEISEDGITYKKVTVKPEMYFVEDEAYGYWKPVRYKYKKESLNASYLKITWQTDMQIAHTIIGP